MNELLALLKTAAPALATAVGGPLGGMAIKAIADGSTLAASCSATPEKSLMRSSDSIRRRSNR